MKRNIFLGALAAGLTLGLGSCDSLLELDPFDSVGTENAFLSNSDFDNALRGLYSGMRDGEYWGGNYIATPDILSDNLILSAEGRTSQINSHYWNLGGNQTWEIWDDGYRIILRANLILENLDNLTDATKAAEVEAEALAVRAMVHFDLARIYAKAPQHAAASDLGIPYMTSSDASQKPARPTVQETFDNILADLNAAVGNMPSGGATRLSQDGVYALLARVNFYVGNDTEALAALNNVLPTPGSGADLVTPRASFEGLWKDENQSGLLWYVAITELDGTSAGVQYSQTGTDGVRSEYVVDFEFYQTYEDNAGDGYTDDIRLDVYFETSDFAGKTQNHIAKWFGRTGASANLSHIQTIRYEELFLTRAELTAASDPTGALADLDVVRNVRYASFTGGETGADLLDMIRLERRKELAFEGHRFFDLKRMNAPVERSTFGDAFDGTGATLPDNVLTLPAGDDRFQLPIPQNELNANENMEQNPGY